MEHMLVCGFPNVAALVVMRPKSSMEKMVAVPDDEDVNDT